MTDVCRVESILGANRVPMRVAWLVVVRLDDAITLTNAVWVCVFNSFCERILIK